MDTANTGKSSALKLTESLKPSTLLPALTAGGANAVLIISMELSFAAMLFSQELSVFVPRGIGMLLLGTFIMGMMGVLKSSHPSCAILVQDAPVAILSLPLLAIARQMAADGAGAESIFYTAVSTIAVSTVATGILILLMARFKLGDLVRFIPYPVIGGFLAGIGWLLFKGGIGVMTGLSLDLSTLGDLFAPMTMLKWGPGLAFGLVLYYLLRNYTHFLILPGMVLGTILMFFIVLSILDVPFSQAEANGWFLGPFPGGSLWKPLSFGGLSSVRWDLVAGQAMTLSTIFFISVISLLLNASGLEVVTRRDIDLNNELKVTGVSNILAAFAGSTTGYLGMSTSALCHRLLPGKRMAGIVTYMICGIVLLVGASVLSGFPRFLAGGMLVLVGYDMLLEWCYDSWRRLPKTDCMLIMVILLIIACIGFLQGVVAGTVISTVLFVITYSRIDIVKGESSGKTLQSNVDRPAAHHWILDRKGDSILILQLHGFIFFGTANRLRNRIVERMKQKNSNALRHIVLDFSKVNGFDSSAMKSFERIHQYAQGQNIGIVFVELNDNFKRQFERAGLDEKAVRFFPDLDHGMEWCENRIIEAEQSMTTARKDQLLFSTFDEMDQALEKLEIFERFLERMEDYLESQTIESGGFLFQKGEKIRGIYFIESGQVSIFLDQTSGPRLRLRTMGAGSILGRWGDCAREGTVTSVVVTKSGRIFHLSDDSLKRMEKEAPELALQLFRFISRVLSDRLCKTTGIIQNLL